MKKVVVEELYDDGVWQRTTFIDGEKAVDEIINPKKKLEI